MFLGQEGSGKTSCVKAMLGKQFNKEEPSTDGIVTTKTVFQTVGEDYNIWEEQKDVDEIERTKQVREHAIATNVAKTFDFTASTSSSDRGRIAFPSTSASPLEGTSAASVSEIDPRKKSSLSPVFIRRFKGKSVSEDTGVSTNGKGVSQDTGVSTNGKGVSADTGVPTNGKGVSQDTAVSTSGKGVSQHTGVSSNQLMTYEIRKKVIDKLANKSSGPSDVTCIWDYAGQLDYYITHRFFLTDVTSYGVVFSLLDALDELAKPRDPQKGFLEMTNLQSILFWIRSIFEHAVLLHGSESKNVIKGMIASPTISLIGTHMDLLPGSDAEKQAKVC
ncbi:probable serine/threonine-protein kinase roco6 [Anneissia japonica]|uniref:probable serine/threonine-protein kinase roco6 n=1 Tax=Anneissia japonica TaxID=1529436 RepID=UPI001425B7DA|nr:probable serine/threonine-protein kinase roco6 [Anneissia japonica]